MAKYLKRILLIHWHFYTHQLIELDQINFLTGKTGVGKTTIIDALQVVLLGDTNARRFFNKAANEKSERTMEGYLSGEYGEDGDRASRSLRKGRFSSIVACEFHETDNSRIFTVGAIFDSYDIGKWASQWFLYNEPIPEHHFIKDNHTPMDITEFKAWIRHLHSKARYQLPASNQQFQNQLAAQLGGLRKNYFSLFRRAVAFTPIQDITSFITDYICDADRSINIHELKENLRHYRRLEIQAAQIKEQVQHLKEGVTLYEDYQNEAANYRLFSFLVRRGEQADREERLQEKETELRLAEDQLAAILAELSGLDAQLESLRHELAGLEQERYGSDLYKKLESLKTSIAQTRQVILEIDQQVGTAINHIRQKTALFAAAADQAAGFARATDRSEDAAAAAQPDQALQQAQSRMAIPAAQLGEACETFRQLNEQSVARFTTPPLADSLQHLAGCMKTFTDTAAWSARQIREQQQAAEAALLTCNKQLQELRQGVKQYPNPGIKRLQALIEQELFARHGRQIPVWIIADELEIIDPRWTDALEGYLHTQKFYLLVEPACFEEALALYDKAKRQQNFYDIGLIDIERLAADKPVSHPGSLAEKVRTDNPLVRLFVEYVLGDVICCDQTADLRKYRRAITDSCMLYQNYVARQLNPNRYKDRYIGKSAILAQIAALEEKAAQLSRFTAACDAAGPRYEAWAALEPFSEYETGSLAAAIGRLAEKEGLSARLNTLNAELAGLDLAWLDRLIERIGRVKNNMAEKEQQVKTVTARRYQLEAGISLVRDRELPLLSQQVEAIRTDIRLHYSSDWLQKEAEPRFSAEYRQRETGLAVRNAFYSPQNRSESQKKQKWERVQTSRADFNRLYQASVSVTAESNRDFEQRLERLEQEKLPDYLEQIRQAQTLAYEQFQSDFLGKLKESIDAVTDSIRELNRTLKDRSWGNERFQFVVDPHPNYRRFYDMIMDDLLMQGYSITYAAFREKHGATVDELFRQILAVDEEATGDQRSELERNIESYCNYRTYLRFDLHTIDENNEVQRLSRTLRKKSGGETQTPYYIAMLAAFVQLYRIGDRNRSCMQLIIFDEAFSKMDGERIRESIRLLRRIGFQCLISAPPDKIADIAPLVDRNICVLKDQHRSFLAYFDKSDIDRIERELDVDRDAGVERPVEANSDDYEKAAEPVTGEA
jgi:energy-coupling factor transporter ATP-binding protein EcfA2